MELLVLVWRQYRWPFISVMALSLASAALGIGLIAFIILIIKCSKPAFSAASASHSICVGCFSISSSDLAALPLWASLRLPNLRSEFIKRILDRRALGNSVAPRCWQVDNDVRNITMARASAELQVQDHSHYRFGGVCGGCRQKYCW